MKAYVVTTGIIFALLVAAHVLRVAEEGFQLAQNPGFVLITALAAGLSLWAWRLLRKMPR
jgi:hypothetical protein